MTLDQSVPRRTSENRPSPHRHLVLAEDDNDFRALLRSALCRDGYRVTEASCGRTLADHLDVLRRRNDIPSMIISDHRMPQIQGLRVFERTRQWGWSSPLLLITAFGHDHLIDEASTMGVTVLHKPFDLDDLRRIVRCLLDQGDPPACAACADITDLQAADEEWTVFFCRSCRDGTAQHEIDEDWEDLGGSG